MRVLVCSIYEEEKYDERGGGERNRLRIYPRRNMRRSVK